MRDRTAAVSTFGRTRRLGGTVGVVIGHHEAAQAAATGWLAIGGLGGVAMAARLAWARLRRR